MKRLLISTLLLIGIFQMNANAQQKFEMESRLKPDDVPKKALQFIDAVEMDTRWKWYFEENLQGNSVEAKTKHQGKRYSVEFDASGKIQDVEVEKSWKEMDDQLRGSILHTLDSLFDSHKLDKIQIQYAAETNVMLEILNKKADQTDSKIQYEIVIKGKTTGRPKLYELTFTENGELLESSEIIFRNTDNLEY